MAQKTTKTFPRLLVRWRGNCWEVHFISKDGELPSDATLINVSLPWSALRSWMFNWEIRTSTNYPSNDDLRRRGNQAHLKRMAISHWNCTAWKEGGMSCPK